MAYETKDVRDFLNQRTAERSKFKRLDWKKRPSKKINTWLHTKRKPVAVWQHPLPKIFVKEDKQTGQQSRVLIFSNGYNCWEPEAVLKKQFDRNEAGQRILFPTKCGLCRLVEIVGELIEAGGLKWTQPLFQFTGDNGTKVLHAGGLIGYFKGTLKDEEKAELKAAHIVNGWGEDARAAVNWLFCVVDNDDVSSGVHMTIETKLIGDKVMEVIGEAMDDLGAEGGDPFVHPFCIQWKYLPDEQVPAKKYAASRITSAPLTPAISELIAGDPPDVSKFTQHFDQTSMRAILERACLVKGMPWDRIFDVPKLVDGGEERDDFPYDDDPKQDDDQPEYDADGDEIVPCEGCGKTMKLKATACPSCGKRY